MKFKFEIEICIFLGKLLYFLIIDSILNYIPILGCKHMLSTNFSKMCCSFAQNKLLKIQNGGQDVTVLNQNLIAVDFCFGWF